METNGLLQITKRYLVRVCKQWKSLASPYLYECLYIGRGRALSSLSSTLKLSEKNSSPHQNADRALGWWTKRVDVVMRDHISVQEHERDITTELLLLSEIFQCLPNLTIIHFGVRAPLYPASSLPAMLLDTIAATSGRCLTAVIWSTDSPIPQKVALQGFLAKTPNMKAIQCPITSFTGLPSQVGSPVSELRSLNYLSIIGVYDSPSLPLLEYLPSLPISRLSMDPITSAGILPQRTLLEKYGGNIRVFQLGRQVLHHDELPLNLRLISRTCLNLSRLDISFCDRMADGADWSALPETIETLGLQHDRGQLPRKEYEVLFDSLCGIKSGSKLKTVQFIDETNVRDICQRHHRVLAKNTERLANIGLELRDHKGHLMQ